MFPSLYLFIYLIINMYTFYKFVVISKFVIFVNQKFLSIFFKIEYILTNIIKPIQNSMKKINLLIKIIYKLLSVGTSNLFLFELLIDIYK